VNIYGRAVGADDRVPKALRHDHLRGPKGLLLPPGGLAGPGPLLLVEGAVDALAAAAAGWGQTVGCFGLSGWDWTAARSAGVREVVLALDQDEPGQEAAHGLARSGTLHGMTVGMLDPSAWNGQKDLAAAWLAGGLDLQSLDLDPGPEREAARVEGVRAKAGLSGTVPDSQQTLDFERITEPTDDGNPWAGIWDRVFGTAQEEAIWLRRLCTR